MMKAERIFGGGKGMYPYKYRIELPEELSRSGIDRDKMRFWIKDMEFKCCLVERAIYVREDQDASLFLLRWSS